MDIMKTKKPKTNPLDTSTKEGAQNMLERLMAGRRMRGGTDGFRAYSTKAGPIRQMTIEDRLQLRMFGTKALPRADRPSFRGRSKECPVMSRPGMREWFAERVRNNPRYPTGDTRLKNL